jgi:hypothetical protein
VKRLKINKLTTLGLLACSPLLMGSLAPLGQFEDRVLAAHNRERDAWGVPALRWNPDLAAGARQWAEYLARSGKFEHSPDAPGAKPLGENLWGGTRSAYQPEAMVGLWIAEKKHFKAGTFPSNSRTGRVEDVGHFTQLIWRGSAEVGCAKAVGLGEDILVCRYSSPGNIIGRVPL